MIVYLTLIGCALGLACLLRRYDMYDREPRWLLALTVILGAVFMWLAGPIETVVFKSIQAVDPSYHLWYVWIACSAALVEECFRLVIVVLIALCFKRHFNDPMDGLIYGAFAGLGMAIEESWANRPAQPTLMTIGTECVRLLSHHLLGGITGYVVGLARFKLSRWPLALITCVGAAMVLHALWDIIAELQGSEYELFHRFAAIMLMLATLGLFGFLVKSASRESARMLEPDTPRSLWGWPFDRTPADLAMQVRDQTSPPPDLPEQTMPRQETVKDTSD